MTKAFFPILLSLFVIGCSREAKNMDELLQRLSHRSEEENGPLIYGYAQAKPEAQRVLLRMLSPLRSPTSDKRLELVGSRRSGRFTMLILRADWSRPGAGGDLQPIILCREGDSERLVGYVLPFNDIAHHFDKQDLASMAQLSGWWIQTYAQK
jgi:hypothetical protein